MNEQHVHVNHLNNAGAAAAIAGEQSAAGDLEYPRVRIREAGRPDGGKSYHFSAETVAPKAMHIC